MNTKRQLGQYFTKGNCFTLKPFRVWFDSIPNIKDLTIIEPFAGNKDIPRLMTAAGYTNNWQCFDILPSSPDVIENDSIKNCPSGTVIITNPPYLAKNSATRRKLFFPKTEYDDLYKLSLERMLHSAHYVAAIIPESFLTANIFSNRVSTVITLTNEMFEDTEVPVCLALFSHDNKFEIYRGEHFVGTIHELNKYMPKKSVNLPWNFNVPDGALGLIAIDNNKEASIRFCHGDEIRSEEIKCSSRSKTRIGYDTRLIDLDELIFEANNILVKLRKETSDVLLTSFKGVRRDGCYRRRLDFRIARLILNSAASTIKSKWVIGKSDNLI